MVYIHLIQLYIIIFDVLPLTELGFFESQRHKDLNSLVFHNCLGLWVPPQEKASTHMKEILHTTSGSTWAPEVPQVTSEIQ
jgi:hypothetical protein